MRTNTSDPMTADEAFSRLSALCARSEQCEHDLRQKMLRWGLPPDKQDAVVARLTEGRYIDEQRYCRAFVNDKIDYSKWGPRKIEQALRQKHVDSELVAEVLAEVDTARYLHLLRPMIDQKRRSTRAATPYELNQKLLRFALGRGFDYDTIRQVLDVEGDTI